MSWFDKVKDGSMMWSVDNEECFNDLERLANGEVECIVAEGNDHHVVFFSDDGSLYEASIKPNHKELSDISSPNPSKSMAGRVENIYEFQEKWGDIYTSKELPVALR